MAVIGVPHSRLGQVLTAVIEPVPGADLRGLRTGARQLLHGESLPRRWFLTDRLPRTPSGKVTRHPVAAAAARLTADSIGDEPPGAGTAAPPDGEWLRLRPLA